jgi:hypothetical protein
MARLRVWCAQNRKRATRSLYEAAKYRRRATVLLSCPRLPTRRHSRGRGRVRAGPRPAPLSAGYVRPGGRSTIQRRLREAQLRRAKPPIRERPPRTRRVGLVPAWRSVESQLGLAFPWCPLPLPLGALFGSESAACGRVHTLLAVVPPDPIGGEGSPRSSSSTTPERGRRSIDSDSATTRLPTSKASSPSLFVLAEIIAVGHVPQRPELDS